MMSKILKNEEEYNKACERAYEIIHSQKDQIVPESDEGEELELLSLLIETYERENFQVLPPTPAEAIRFRMEQLNLKQADIAPLFGGKTRVSEVLNLKRPLTLKMISLLHNYLDIPLESLISDEKRYKLNSKKEEQIMQNPVIRSLKNRKLTKLV
jgi:HTH-type transcriptional regulator/antitoxin HigA